jgi:hypothetical protein
MEGEERGNDSGFGEGRGVSRGTGRSEGSRAGRRAEARKRWRRREKRSRARWEEWHDGGAPRRKDRAESRGEEEQELMGKKASSSSMGQGSLAGHGRLFVAMLEAVRWG